MPQTSFRDPDGFIQQEQIKVVLLLNSNTFLNLWYWYLFGTELSQGGAKKMMEES